ncbi:FadR/GntR family transcriptional regulator [Brevirhabdus sp.]|uniref:FadR/GntR family transcriptional regulator n=1 Tax=Brevirhabdus sp. TaxID=2004514 RepID=UPI004058324A
MKYELASDQDLSIQIAAAIHAAIVSGGLDIGERLPSEAELAERFRVSRPTVREALKRLAAQNLIRTRRGAAGGAFVNRLTYRQACDQLVTTSTLLLSMNDVSFETACEARYALERACAPLGAERRGASHLERLHEEIAIQRRADLSDEGFCASDVRFHRTLVEAAANPVLTFHLSGAVEAMQPLMNMITFTGRSRGRIVGLHADVAAALDRRDAEAILTALGQLQDYTVGLFHAIRQRRAHRKSRVPHA